MKSSLKTGLTADQEDCIGYFPNNFEAETYIDDTSGIVAEDEIQHYMMSHKRKRSDVDDNNVPTMPQLGETEPCNFNLLQLFASGKIEIVY